MIRMITVVKRTQIRPPLGRQPSLARLGGAAFMCCVWDLVLRPPWLPGCKSGKVQFKPPHSRLPAGRPVQIGLLHCQELAHPPWVMGKIRIKD